MTISRIFVFGSNLAGRHGKGAALYAKTHFGAEGGVGEGLTGNSYALPTKDRNLVSLALPELFASIDRFITFASKRSDLQFILTPVGCGLAGNSAKGVAHHMRCRLPANVALHTSWLDHFS